MEDFLVLGCQTIVHLSSSASNVETSWKGRKQWNPKRSSKLVVFHTKLDLQEAVNKFCACLDSCDIALAEYVHCQEVRMVGGWANGTSLE